MNNLFQPVSQASFAGLLNGKVLFYLNKFPFFSTKNTLHVKQSTRYEQILKP